MLSRMATVSIPYAFGNGIPEPATRDGCVFIVEFIPVFIISHKLNCTKPQCNAKASITQEAIVHE